VAFLWICTCYDATTAAVSVGVVRCVVTSDEHKHVVTSLDLEAELLLLVRKVAGGCSQQGHAHGTDDARDLSRARF